MAFSAVTVAAALAALMVFPQRFLFSMGVGGVIVAVVAATVALVVLPAVLALLGTRINSLAPKSWRSRSEHADEEITSGFWYRLSHAVMRRPGPSPSVTAVTLIILGAARRCGIHFTAVDAACCPPARAARQVADTLATRLPAGPQRADLHRHRRPEAAEARALAGYAAAGRAARRHAVTPPQPAGPGHLAHRRLLLGARPLRGRARRW